VPPLFPRFPSPGRCSPLASPSEMQHLAFKWQSNPSPTSPWLRPPKPACFKSLHRSIAVPKSRQPSRPSRSPPLHHLSTMLCHICEATKHSKPTSSSTAPPFPYLITYVTHCEPYAMQLDRDASWSTPYASTRPISMRGINRCG